MIYIIDTEKYGLTKCTDRDIEKFKNYYLISTRFDNKYIYGITDSNFNEIRTNKFTLFNEIEKTIVPYEIIVCKKKINNKDIFLSYTFEKETFTEIKKPSDYIINKANNNNSIHKIKSQSIIENECIILESNFYYFPTTKMLSYMEAYDTMVEIEESRESATLYNYFSKNTNKKARVLKK